VVEMSVYPDIYIYIPTQIYTYIYIYTHTNMNSGSVILRDDQTMLPYTMLTNTMTTVDGLVRQTMEARVQTHFSFPFLFVSAV